MKRKDVFTAFEEHERTVLHGFLTHLLDADEPEALLASLKRIAERKAFGVTFGRIGAEEAARWQRMADALHRVEREYNDKSHNKLHTSRVY